LVLPSVCVSATPCITGRCPLRQHCLVARTQQMIQTNWRYRERHLPRRVAEYLRRLGQSVHCSSICGIDVLSSGKANPKFEVSSNAARSCPSAIKHTRAVQLPSHRRYQHRREGHRQETDPGQSLKSVTTWSQVRTVRNRSVGRGWSCFRWNHPFLARFPQDPLQSTTVREARNWGSARCV
jgi:hypothetical protein